jgi:ADP-heptose:LPS heptosyltransferase
MTVTASYTPPPNPGDTLRRVLVIKLGAMGDFIQALGAMRVVRAAHPSARITLLTTEPFEAFARACPYFDIVEADGRPKDIKGRTELIRRIRQAGYDMVYDFQTNSRTEQYFAGLAGRKPLWSGAAEGASHPHRNPARQYMPPLERLAEQLVHAGLRPGPPGEPSGWIEGYPLFPDLSWIRPAFRNPPRFQPEYFSLNGPYALLVPGSSSEHPERRWNAAGYVAVAKWLADGGVAPVIIGARSEGEVGGQIARGEPRARNLVGRTDLFQLATLAERAVMVVGGETGPMHLAVAAGAGGVCICQQAWTAEMAAEFGSVWNPALNLARAAPVGRSPVAVLYAGSLDAIAPEDVMRAAVRMGFLPSSFEAPPVKPPSAEAQLDTTPPSPGASPLGEPALFDADPAADS